MRRILVALVLVLSLWVPVSTARAVTAYYVGSTGSDTVTTGCSDPANATCTLRGALNTSFQSGLLVFGAHYPINGVIDVRPNGISLYGSLTIDGADRHPVLDGGGTTAVLGVSYGPTTLKSLTFQHGGVQGSYATSATGISNSATLTLQDCVVRNNDGGGIANSGMLSVMHTLISGNTGRTSDGGGINNTGQLTMRASTVSNNTASFPFGVGGGIAATGAMQVETSAITGNSAGNGGGIYISTYLNSTIKNSTISGNTANGTSPYGGFGGGIYAAGSNFGISVSNSTITGNTAPQGAGIAERNTSSTTAPFPYLLLTNSIDASNAGDNVDVYGSALYPDLSSDITGQFTFASPLQDNGGPSFTLAIPTPATPGASDAYQHYSCDSTAGTDQRGTPRGASGRCSVGAYEPGKVISATSFILPVSIECGGSPFAAQVAGIIGGVPYDGASVSAIADGTSIGAASLTGGLATFSTAMLSAGNHSLSATFGGDTTYLPSTSAPQSLVVTPNISSVNPIVGDPRGGYPVTVNGSCFVAGTTGLVVDGVPLPILSTTPTTITFSAPAHASGAVAIAVTVNGKTKTLPKAFTYGIAMAIPATHSSGQLQGIPSAPSLHPTISPTGIPLPQPGRR